jgi:hypothetical protein
MTPQHIELTDCCSHGLFAPAETQGRHEGFFAELSVTQMTATRVICTIVRVPVPNATM